MRQLQPLGPEVLGGLGGDWGAFPYGPCGLSGSLASVRGDAWGYGMCCQCRRPLRSLLLDQGQSACQRHRKSSTRLVFYGSSGTRT